MARYGLIDEHIIADALIYRRGRTEDSGWSDGTSYLRAAAATLVRKGDYTATWLELRCR